jgi:hypothetical protein
MWLPSFNLTVLLSIISLAVAPAIPTKPSAQEGQDVPIFASPGHIQPPLQEFFPAPLKLSHDWPTPAASFEAEQDSRPYLSAAATAMEEQSMKDYTWLADTKEMLARRKHFIVEDNRPAEKIDKALKHGANNVLPLLIRLKYVQVMDPAWFRSYFAGLTKQSQGTFARLHETFPTLEAGFSNAPPAAQASITQHSRSQIGAFQLSSPKGRKTANHKAG